MSHSIDPKTFDWEALDEYALTAVDLRGPKREYLLLSIEQAKEWYALHGAKNDTCDGVAPGIPFECTRKSGHEGIHIAHGCNSPVCAIWN